MKNKQGKQANIWAYYNPKAYLLKLVQFEDDKAHVGKEDYRRSPMYFDNRIEVKFYEKLKNFGRIMLV